MMKMKEFKEIYCSEWKFFCCNYRYIETNITSHIDLFNQMYGIFFLTRFSFQRLLCRFIVSVYIYIYFIHSFTTASNIYNKLGHDRKITSIFPF